VCECVSVSECECAGILGGWSPYHEFESTQASPEHGAPRGMFVCLGWGGGVVGGVESVKHFQGPGAGVWGGTLFCLQKPKEFLAPKGLGWMALGLGRATLLDKFNVIYAQVR